LGSNKTLIANRPEKTFEITGPFSFRRLFNERLGARLKAICRGAVRAADRVHSDNIDPFNF
jgi:hypothetical protein